MTHEQRQLVEKLSTESMRLSPREQKALKAALRAAQETPADSRDAHRYRRLRVLGAAPGGSPQLDRSTVLRFTGLDDFVDADLQAQPDRGEATPSVPQETHTGLEALELLRRYDMDSPEFDQEGWEDDVTRLLKRTPPAAPTHPPPADAKEWTCPTCRNDVLFHCKCPATPDAERDSTPLGQQTWTTAQMVEAMQRAVESERSRHPAAPSRFCPHCFKPLAETPLGAEPAAPVVAEPVAPEVALVGCDRPDGTLNIHFDTSTCEVCAPVVAPAPGLNPPVAPPAPETVNVVAAPLYCFGGCGTRYEDFPCDLVLPTPLWNRIATGAPFDETQPNTEREGRGGVLCPACIVKRLAQLISCIEAGSQTVAPPIVPDDARSRVVPERRLDSGHSSSPVVAPVREPPAPVAPPRITAESLEFCYDDADYGPSCPFCSASPNGQHRDDCAWQSFARRSRVAESINQWLTASPRETAQ